MSKPSELPPIPDFLGIAGRVQSVSDLLEQAQQQLQNFRGLRLVNADELDDPIPGSPADNPVSYQERIDALDSGIAALLADNQDIADELTAEALKRRKARENA